MSKSIYTRAVSTITLFSFWSSLIAPQVARSQAEPIEVELTDGAEQAADSREAWSEGDVAEPEGASAPDDKPETADVPAEEQRPLASRALPTSEAKSAATPQAIALPQAEGSIKGMGESFTPDLSAGTGAFSVPIEVPSGRAGVQPSLALHYSTAAGNGIAGIGWDVPVAFIARQTDKGLPRYVGSADGLWHEREDTFVYNGSQELVPVDNAAATLVDGAPVPADLASYQQYRARVESSFARFFRAPDGLSWVVQEKDGTRLDFGVLPGGQGPAEVTIGSTEALVSEYTSGQGRVFSWALTRMSDAHGSAVYFRYFNDAGQRYLSDIHYVSPASCAGASATEQRDCVAPLAEYGRRIRFVYEQRDDSFDSYVSTWRVTSGLRLSRVEVTAAETDTAGRTLVRRYHLRYEPESFLSLLSELQVEGRPDAVDPASQAVVADRYVPEDALSADIIGRTLPAMRFAYSQPSATSFAVDGFPGIDASVHASASSPPHSIDEARSDFYDVNSDGLPDVIVTDPARYQTDGGEPAVGVFFNGFRGANSTPARGGEFSSAIPMALPRGYANVMQLSNANIAPMDIDGDGRSDLLHMPRVASYDYFTPVRQPDTTSIEVLPARQGWRFARIPVDLPATEIDPRIDLGRDTSFIKTFDVDNDHLIDIVRTTGSVMQTWLNLGRYPGGEGLFGSARYISGGYQFSTEPIESCLLQEGRPVDFADAEIQIADMNGDGIQDVVELRRDYVAYWPGRGPGLWGDGAASCLEGEGEGRAIVMSNPPNEVNPELDGVLVSDVNHDGASDIVQVRFDAVDVWFNRAGHGFTDRTTASGTPPAPSFASSVRVLDIDGSGTTDIVYADGLEYRWIDPMSGRRPRLLTVLDNGLGGVTQLAYGSSVEDYLRDLAAAGSCTDLSCDSFTWSFVAGACDQKIESAGEGCAVRSAGSPVVSNVVRTAVQRDGMNTLGQAENVRRVELAYHDGYYEGIEQEFRGFGAADSIAIGEPGHPTSITQTRFHQGRRAAEIASDRLADNPDEALKGRAYQTEVRDAGGVYLSSSYVATTLREILRGRNDVAVTLAFARRTDEVRYDTAPFTATPDALLTDPFASNATDFDFVRRERAGVGLNDHPPMAGETPQRRTLAVRGARYAHVVTTTDDVDNAGNTRQTTAHGRVRGEAGEALTDEAIVSHTLPARIDLGATGQWLWRLGESYITGHGDAGQQLERTIHSYDAVGDLRLTRHPVTRPPGTPAFEYAGDSDGSAAYALASEDVLLSSAYDTWGNALRTCSGADLGTSGTAVAGCLRLRELTFDEQHHQFATEEAVAVSGADGALTWLRTEALWDQGLGVPLVVFDPNRLATALGYDGLGRFSSLVQPDVYECSGRALPTVRFSYQLAEPGLPINVVRVDREQSCAAVGGDTFTTLLFFDGFGRKRVELIEAEDPDDPAIATRIARRQLITLHARGATRETFQGDIFDGTIELVTASDALAPPRGIPYVYNGYDAFGRTDWVAAEDGSVTRTRYHALSQDTWDALDSDHGSPHYGTPRTDRMDGHGRVIDSVLRNRQTFGGAIEHYRLLNTYRADGSVVAITRAQTATDAPNAAPVATRTMTRAFTFDSRGRRLASHDPDTDDPAKPTTRRSWRYLFNRADDLVAVRDPRGCGQNFFYDRAARLIGEAYVGCSEAQVAGEQSVDTVPAGSIAMTELASATPVDVRQYFDVYPDWFDNSEGFDIVPTGANRILGRATAMIDRAQRSAAAYDDRGNVIWQARQMAVIPNPDSISLSLSNPPAIETSDAISLRPVAYDTTTYVVERDYDHAGRARAVRLPADPDYAGTAPRIGGVVDYNVRGLTSRTALSINAGVRSIIDRVDYTRDGLPERMVFGDAMGGAREATVSQTFYDIRRRPQRSFVLREPTAEPDFDPAEGRPLGAVSLVADQSLVWDAVNNLIAVHDMRDGREWRTGFRPVSYTVAHDALYRVTTVDHDYTQDNGTRTPSDAFVDYRSELEAVEDSDPMASDPAPLLPSAPPGRVVSLTYEYDWLANMVESTDDAAQFYERSLGRVSNGADASGDRPSALRLASDLPTSSPASYAPGVDRGGYLELDYGTGGNVVSVTAHAQCHDHDGVRCYDNNQLALAARRTHLRSNCECDAEQNYQYRYDELNRIVDARRFDRGGAGSWSLSARQRYRYDGANQRAVKVSMAISGDIFGEIEPTSTNERIALYPYPGDFERRGLTRDELDPRYEASGFAGTETQYVVSDARVVIRNGATSVLGQLDRDARITMPLMDAIRSTTGVIDLMSGALVETSAYYPTGARESYRAPDGPGEEIAAEPRGFTGKEADEEVGITYFGERYLLARCGRWATPDPMSIHSAGGGEVGNSYHYVSGNLLQARDPLGLMELEVGLLDVTNDALLTATRATGVLMQSELDQHFGIATVKEDDWNGCDIKLADTEQVEKSHAAAVQRMRDAGASETEIKRWEVARERLIKLVDSSDEVDIMTDGDKGPLMLGEATAATDPNLNPFSWFDASGSSVQGGSSPDANAQMGPTMTLLHELGHTKGCMSGSADCSGSIANMFNVKLDVEQVTVDDVNAHTDAIPNMTSRPTYSSPGSGKPGGTLNLADGQTYTFPNHSQLTTGTGQTMPVAPPPPAPPPAPTPAPAAPTAAPKK